MVSRSSSPARVGAVVVTYHPDPAKLARMLAALASQVADVLVVDNGSPADLLDPVQDCPANVRLRPLERNRGIAAAHNIGIEEIRASGATHVLLMDQDSMPAPDMVARLLDAEAALRAAGRRVGAVGPRYFDRRQGRFVPFVSFRGLRALKTWQPPASQPAIEVDLLISSGSLVPLDVLARVGGMAEALFIDNVDLEWGFRAQAAGYELFGVWTAEMEHFVGHSIVRLPGGFDVIRHPPSRLYYMTRNRILLYRMKHVPWNWVILDLFRLAAKLFFFCSLIPPRRENSVLMARGLWHGLIGRSGPL